MKVSNNLKAAADKILRTFNRRGRGLLVVPLGFNSYQFLMKTLKPTKSKIAVVNLKGVKTNKEVDRMFSKIERKPRGYDSLCALNILARRRPITLLIENLDAIEETEDEGFVLGDLRGQLQFMADLSVFFAVSDATFVARMVGPDAAFNGIQIIQLA